MPRSFSPCVACLLAALLSACNRAPATTGTAPVEPFRDGAQQAGLNFQHYNAMSGQFYMPEMMGGGVALLDYNNDGRLDIFLAQGGPFGPNERGGARGPVHALFRNDLEIRPNGETILKFTNVTAEAGLNFSDNAMGVATADFDNDGWMDLYITTLGPNRLLRNRGNGTFEDVTAASGTAGDGGWSSSASWTDYDRDGLLDLYVAYYVNWSYDAHRACSTKSGRPNYCSPKAFEPSRSRLYRNLGNSRFEDVSIASGIRGKAGAGLGVAGADIDRDGWPDFLVANDGMANFLWINQRNGKFREEALVRGCAYDMNGDAEANMGIIVADFRAKGLEDLFITHLMGEKNTYFHNLGNGYFEDASGRYNLDAASRPFTGFGTGAIDYDNDGFLDIFVANGAVALVEAQIGKTELALRQRSQLFRNLGGSTLRFEEVTAGGVLQREEVGRGAAFGDLDNDGDLDIVVTNNNGPVRLLLNQVGQQKHWLGLRLLDGPPDRPHDVLGAIARLHRADGRVSQIRAATDGSYVSSSDPRILFGLGDKAEPSTVEVQWPDGLIEEWKALAPGKYHELLRGSRAKVSTR